jgi:RND family efflux transporter MFP subunit
MMHLNKRKSWAKWLKWIVTLIVVTGIAISVMRVLKARKAQQETVAAATAANAKAQSVVELASHEIVTVQTGDLTLTLPFTGTIRATRSAFIKARVPGDLQGLLLREGDTVKAGQIIARVEVTEYAARLQQAQDQAEAAKAQILIAQRQFENNKALVEQGFISKTALDTSLATLNSAQATYRAALANIDLGKKAVQDTVLRSPLSGVIAQRLVQNGERVSVDTRVLEVIDLSQMEVEAAMSPSDAMKVRIGQQAEINVEGRSAALNSLVARINPNAQLGSRNVLVYFNLATAPSLRQGLFVQGVLNTGKITGLLVPSHAIRMDKPTPYVQVIENNKVRHQTVPVGTTGQMIINTRPVSVAHILPGVLNENSVLVAGTVGILREGTSVKLTDIPATKSN